MSIWALGLVTTSPLISAAKELGTQIGGWDLAASSCDRWQDKVPVAGPAVVVFHDYRGQVRPGTTDRLHCCGELSGVMDILGADRRRHARFVEQSAPGALETERPQVRGCAVHRYTEGSREPHLIVGHVPRLDESKATIRVRSHLCQEIRTVE